MEDFMKKPFLLISIFFLAISVIFSQNTQNTVDPVPQMDEAVKVLAGNIHKKLTDEKARKIAFGQITYQGNRPSFCTYWINQLTDELANNSNRSYIILSGGPAGADWTITGEIVDAAGTLRVYTRLIRSEDRAVEGAFQSDFERTAALAAMLSGGGSGSSSPSYVDDYEPDSWENPLAYDIGVDDNAALINRAISPGGDEDFFLLVPDRDGRLTMETTGGTDTYMEFYNAETREKLAENDDGGQGSNARIRYNVEAGRRYIAKIRGYSSSTTGNYAFRAYMHIPVRPEPDEYVPDDDPSQASLIEIETPQTHTFLNADDVDWVKFQVTRPGRHVIRTRGVISDRLDTFIRKCSV